MPALSTRCRHAAFFPDADEASAQHTAVVCLDLRVGFCNGFVAESSSRCAGDFKPPEEAVKAEASASGKAPSTAVRLLSFIGNTVFYGGLLGGAGFFASTYAYTDDDVRRIRNEAKQQRGHGAVASAKFEALDRFLDAREWYTERVKGFTGAQHEHRVSVLYDGSCAGSEQCIIWSTWCSAAIVSLLSCLRFADEEWQRVSCEC
jgi:hypothetical protein